MINKNLNKKGALEAKMLISIILLIAGFGIILFVYSQLNWTGNIDREICHESVILRGTLPDTLLKSAKEVVPLKCKTKNICVTSKIFGKGECESDFGKKGKYDTIKINDDKKEDNIKMVFAREMADCWSMMGEGKIQVFKRELTFSETTKKCVICSRINFDSSLSDLKEIKGMSDYLLNYNVPNKNQSYWKYLTNSDSSNNLFIKKETELSEQDIISTKEKSIVFVEAGQTTIPSFLTTFLGAEVGIVAGAYTGTVIGSFVPIVGSGVGFVAGTGIGVAGTLVGYLSGTSIEKSIDFDEEVYGSGVFIIDYTPEGIKSIGCETLENIS
tara:strand:+ start:49 stop:1032 length:984 start_codon:yes stop_codon:yes gene_type:complete